MKVQIIATKDCSHRSKLEHKLINLDTEYEVLFAEDHPEITKKHAIRNSPNLLIDGEVVFRAKPGKPLPSSEELEEALLDRLLWDK